MSSNQQAPARSELVKTFGTQVRQHRYAKGWSLRDLAEKVGVGFTYLSRVENERLKYGDYPSDALIHRLADALAADEEELLILSQAHTGTGEAAISAAARRLPRVRHLRRCHA